MSFFKDKVQSAASIEACSSGNNAEDAVSAIKIVPVANAAAANILTISNAAMGQATTLTIPDPAASTANVMLDAGTTTAKTITTLTSTTINAVNIDAGSSGTAGSVDVFPATAANGKMILSAVNAGGAFNTTISNSAMGQSSVISIPDPGAATSKFVLQDGTNASATITNATVTNLTIGATALGATAAEINQHVDDSAMVETIATASAASVTVQNSKLEVSGGGAVTLAAPGASMLGRIKYIEMTADTGDVTISLANVQGGSAATTATFSAVGQSLTLVGAANSKWTVIKEFGVALT